MAKLGSKCAIFSCLGLGDGLIIQTLANNLIKSGCSAVTFHPFLDSLQSWFPKIPIRPFPSLEELAEFDTFFIVYEKTERMLAVLDYCEAHHPESTFVLNPIATPNQDYPYWEVGKFDGNEPYLDNLVAFCRNELGISEASNENGIVVPKGVKPGSFSQRIVIHPKSSREGKNWKQSGFIKLAEHLKRDGYDPVFILTEEEKKNWSTEAPSFNSLDEVARFVAESGWMIGNDSGIGHLASCLGLPTLTICRSTLATNFWRPSWTSGRVISPPKWIPNLKGTRWRDRKWKHFIPEKKVYNEFNRLVAASRT